MTLYNTGEVPKVGDKIMVAKIKDNEGFPMSMTYSGEILEVVFISSVTGCLDFGSDAISSHGWSPHRFNKICKSWRERLQ